MVGGPTVGFYTIGIFMPFISEGPAVSGLVSGLAISIWVFIGQNQFPPGSEWTRPMKQTIESCNMGESDLLLNQTIFLDNFETSDSTGLMGLYHVSYW